MKLIDRADRYCGSADWSTDDLRIVYSKNRNGSTDDKDLVLYDIVSGNKQILTTSFNNISAKFTNKNTIIYSQQNNSSSDIYSMNIDGSDKKMIIPNAGSPVLSPDYKRIAYMSEAATWNPQIFAANVDGSHSSQLTNAFLRSWDSGFPDFGNYNPHWTPDGKMIVYESQINDGESEIYIMNSDGSGKERLTDTDGHNTEPEVSLDGKFIIFSSNRNLSFHSDIYVMDIHGKDQNPLSKYFNDDCCPVLASK
jgi:Tol biopolymer transport system component